MHHSLRERARSEGGFTLIELLVVMIIIAILMAVAVPTFLAQKNTAQKSKATANIKQIATAIESCATNDTSGAIPAMCLSSNTTTGLPSYEKGLLQLTQSPLSLQSTAATAINQYGIEAIGTQGYRVSTAIKDGDIATLFFWETHAENGTVTKGCGTALGTAAAVSGSRTCTNGNW